MTAIGGPSAIALLRSKISYPDKDIRYQVLLSLSSMEYHASASEVPFIKQTIEEMVETMVWIMASLTDVGGSVESMNLQDSLLREMEEKKENIFLLLSLLYDAKTIQHIRENIESPDKNAKIYALEVCDMTVPEEVKELFLPLFEDISINERLGRFSLRFPQEKLAAAERLKEIVNKDYTKINAWTKACAIDLFGQIASESSPGTCAFLAANLVNPEMLISEVAAFHLSRIDPVYYNNTLLHLRKGDTGRIRSLTTRISAVEKGEEHLLYHKIRLLKNSELFAPVPDLILLDLAKSIGDHPMDDKTGLEIRGEDQMVRVPYDKLFEMMAGDLVLTGRYISLYINSR